MLSPYQQFRSLSTVTKDLSHSLALLPVAVTRLHLLLHRPLHLKNVYCDKQVRNKTTSRPATKCKHPCFFSYRCAFSTMDLQKIFKEAIVRICLVIEQTRMITCGWPLLDWVTIISSTILSMASIPNSLKSIGARWARLTPQRSAQALHRHFTSPV